MPKDTYDKTNVSAILFIAPHLEREYGLPPEINFEVSPPDMLLERYFGDLRVQQW